MGRVAGVLLMIVFAMEALVLAGVFLASWPPRGPLMWIALVGLLGAQAATVWAYFRIAGRVMRPEHVDAVVPRRADARPPVAPVSEDALAAVPEPVTACPECGFLGIRMPELVDGLWPGGGSIGGRMVCPRCGYQGLPASFDRRDQYGAFLRDLHEGARAAPTA